MPWQPWSSTRAGKGPGPSGLWSLPAMRWGAPGVALSKEIFPAHPAATVVAKTATRASRRAFMRGSIAQSGSTSRAACGTIPEGGWRRCGAMAASDGITYTPWPRDDYPNWSLPALEAAKCVALQGSEAFDRLHLRLYEAFFSRSINIAKPDELLGVVKETGVD